MQCCINYTHMKDTELQEASNLLNELRHKLEDEHIVRIYRAFHHRVVTQEDLAKLFERSQVQVSRLLKKATEGENAT
jgi:hypothetical protein